MRIRSHAGAVLVLLAALLPLGEAWAQADSTGDAVAPAKAEAIRTFLGLTRVTDQVLVGLETALAVQAKDPTIPEGFMEKFSGKAKARVSELVDLMVPIFAKHMTLEEVQGFNAFFRTPLGARLVDVQLAVPTEMGKLGQRWGLKLAGEVLMEMSQ